MRELHGNGVAVATREVGAQHVETGVHPAPPALPLVVDRLLGRLDTEVSVSNLVVAIVPGKVVDGICRHGIANGFVLVGGRGSNDLTHHVRADTTLGTVLC